MLHYIMKKSLFVFIFFSIFCLLTAVKAAAQTAAAAIQNPPVGTETMFSNRGVYFQMLVNKKLQSLPRLGLFSVTSLVGEWHQQEISDLMTQASITYKVIKGLNLGLGYHATPVTGFKPSAGLVYSYADPVWLLVVNPRADLSQAGSVEGLILFEFKPRINESWRLYSRMQGLYGYTPETGSHARSYMKLRLGFALKEFAFGLGANLDYYGPARLNKNSIGAFVSAKL
jgi:hypothetical protein